MSIPLGRDDAEHPVVWDLEASPHLLLTGAAGTGKTPLIRTVVTAAARLGWAVWILDPKREHGGFRDWPNVQVVPTSFAQMVVVIDQAHAEMERRYAQIELGEIARGDLDPLIVIINDHQELVASLTHRYSEIRDEGTAAVCPALDTVFRLARKGAGAGVHLVVAAQRPAAAFMSGELRDTFRARVALGRQSAATTMILFGSPGAGVPIAGDRGRGLASFGNGQLVEMWAHHTPDPRDITSGVAAHVALLRQLRPAEARYQPLRVVLDEDNAGAGDDRGSPRLWETVAAGTLQQLEPTPISSFRC